MSWTTAGTTWPWTPPRSWQARRDSIRTNFDRVLWNASRNGYRSPGYTRDTDDRAHALWVEINLGADTDLDAVRLFPRTDTAAAGGGTAGFPVDFTIQTRADCATSTGVTMVFTRAVAGLAALGTPVFALGHTRLMFGMLFVLRLIAAVVGLVWVPRLPRADGSHEPTAPMTLFSLRRCPLP